MMAHLEDFICLVVLLRGHAGQRVGLEEGGRVGPVVQRLRLRRGGRGAGGALAAAAAALAVHGPLLEQQLFLPVDLLLFRRDLLLPPNRERSF